MMTLNGEVSHMKREYGFAATYMTLELEYQVPLNYCFHTQLTIYVVKFLYSAPFSNLAIFSWSIRKGVTFTV